MTGTRKIQYEPKASENKKVKKRERERRMGAYQMGIRTSLEKLPGAKVGTRVTQYVTIALLYNQIINILIHTNINK